MTTKSQLQHISLPLNKPMSGSYLTTEAHVNMGFSSEKNILAQIPEFDKTNLTTKSGLDGFYPRLLVS